MSYPKDSKIIIAGSGVFGLSSAMHLIDNGYTDVTIFDRLDLYALGYSFMKGADTASADINKVFRAFYNGDELYHKLALQAREKFVAWDEEVSKLTPEQAKEKFNMEGRFKILDQCGVLRLDKGTELPEYMVKAVKDFENSGLRDKEYILNDPEDIERAKKDGWGEKATNTFGVKEGKNPYLKEICGVFDSTSGLLSSYNACLYVNSYLRSKGVKFITGTAGTVLEVIQSKDGTAEGFKTADGETHNADLVIVACGPWSASLIPELAGLSEAQNGNVVLVKIPDDKKDLIAKYSPENFPMISWRLDKAVERERFAGMLSFPLSTNDGMVKFIIRQKKYNNPTKLDTGVTTSVPVTTNSTPAESRVSKAVIEQVKQFIKVFVPDLAEFGIHSTRLLWYTDTINNDFIIDHVPGKKNLVVVTGGSGHGFKFLPVLGKFVVELLQGKQNEKRFNWRDPKSAKDINTIGTVLTGENAYYKQELATEEDLKFTKEDLEAPVEI
ncbi:L-pipecolate oxidase [Cyberlindnera fabianii]|uniref:L-pipecolate oxidase n=1 Tax=Cyberlindnera fabianii TaxID=36022 RepID=A0A1V2L1J6_CYBFA|nr:L-pipecolate oxidase [Cyberlindnera fabianii]